MRQLYSTDSAAAMVYSIVIFLWIGSEAVILIRTVARVGPRAHVAGNTGQDRFSGPALIGGVLLTVAVGSSFAERFPPAAIAYPRPAIFALGVGLALAGIALRWYAVLTLGRFFTTRVQTSADQQVVESGPYRLIRHPSYTGGLMTILGVLLMATNWLALVSFLLAVPGFAYRIHVEETALTATLGDRYRDYMRRTKRLVPFLV